MACLGADNRFACGAGGGGITRPGANEFVAVNPEADSEEEFYLAQLREDVFAKVQSVVHVLWLDRAGAGKKSVWQFDEYDSVPCGSIICRVKLAVSGSNVTLLSCELVILILFLCIFFSLQLPHRTEKMTRWYSRKLRGKRCSRSRSSTRRKKRPSRR